MQMADEAEDKYTIASCIPRYRVIFCLPIPLQDSLKQWLSGLHTENLAGGGGKQWLSGLHTENVAGGANWDFPRCRGGGGGGGGGGAKV